MSEGSFWPRTWKEALPLIVWGILIFAAGFEGVASLVHGEWISSGVSFAIMLGLTAMLLHWKAWLETVNPNWVAGSAIALIIAIAVSPFVRQGQWPAASWESVGVGAFATLIVVAIVGALVSLFIAAKRPAAVAARQVAVEIDERTRLDLCNLLAFAIDHATVLYLTDLIMKAPMKIVTAPLKVDGDTEAAEASADFVRHVSINLKNIPFLHQAFLDWMAHTEDEAEHTIEQIPQDRRPSGIDPLVVRRCAVANWRCIRAMEFLQHERRKGEQALINRRSELDQRLLRRMPH
jgi:hypothetical protein